ncbi:hypothetical protein C5167_046238 [Papaver somniferum]|uniref:Protein MIZU-KUSSEI 1 n=2 Tax=Papaver somniferum TaxID=3469 RepID=A0A4Y7LD87_PAPSO|nr:hypothetical protein C5167_046238 [Papaver somniferum]
MSRSSSSSTTTTRTSNSSASINHQYQYSYDIDRDHIDYNFSISSSSTNTEASLVSRKSGGSHHAKQKLSNVTKGGPLIFFSIIRSFFRCTSICKLFPSYSCHWINLPSKVLAIAPSSSSPNLGRKFTGTLYGHKKGHVNFAVQHDPKSEPVLLLELGTSTAMLVKEMSSGLVRIALECEKKPSDQTNGGRGRSTGKIFQEPMWTMYCNGKKYGYAVSRTCSESDWHVLNTIQTVSAGAGVIPMDKARMENWSDGELMYMRAKFDRVVGSRDSEAFYMLSPDGTGGPELSIFLLRI